MNDRYLIECDAINKINKSVTDHASTLYAELISYRKLYQSIADRLEDNIITDEIDNLMDSLIKFYAIFGNR